MLLAETAVRFDTCREILATEAADVRRRRESKRPARAECVAEFPRGTGKIFLGNEVSGDVPSVVIAGKNQLRLDLPLLLQPRLGIRRSQVHPRIKADELAQRFVRSAGVRELDVQHWIDRMFFHQEANAVLDPVAGEERTLA